MPSDSSQPASSAVDATGPSVPTVEIAFDAMSALLGGAKAADVLANQPAATPMAAALDGPRAWLSPGMAAKEPSTGMLRQFNLEVASLKLRCFDALVRVLIGKNHTGPLPAALVAGRLLDRPGSITPARWSLELHVHTANEASDTATLSKSLSNLLARLLLANDARTPEQAESLASGLVQEFASDATAKGTTAKDELVDVAQAVVARSEIANGNQVVYSGANRDRITDIAIPSNVWSALTTLMIRLQSDVEGFAFGAAPLLDVFGHLPPILQQLDIATFGAMARRDEISAAVRNHLAKLPR